MNSSKIIPDSKQEKKILIYSIAVITFLLLLDQITKAVIEKYWTQPIEVIPSFFYIVKVGNPGAAWGMLGGQRWLLLGIAIIFFISVLLFFRKITEGFKERYYALALVLSGILGNSVDRIWRGGVVVDFLDFNLGFMRWPAFNVADSAICIGVSILLLSSWIRPEKDDLPEAN